MTAGQHHSVAMDTGFGVRPFIQTLRLGGSDFLHEAGMSACAVISLATVLAPLLVLFGIKFGVIDTMATRLINNPHNREIIGVGTGRFDAQWFESIRRRPDVGFVLPETRRLSATFNWVDAPATGGQVQGVSMVPTAPGDPLLADAAVPLESDTDIVLSAQTAQRLQIGVGATVVGVIQRSGDGGIESGSVTLHVRGVAPEAALPGEGVFVPLGLLIATEDFRDGWSVERFQWPGPPRPPGERLYPRFRLYAQSLYSVIPLRDALLDRGIEVRARGGEVEMMQSLDRNLNRIFWVVAALACSGFLTSFGASLVAGVERKRRDLSVLRLLGFPGYAIIAFPFVQAMLIGLCGSVLAVAAFTGVAEILNRMFAASLQEGEFICRLLIGHIAVGISATLVCAMVASLSAGRRAALIQPAEGLRHV